MAHSMSSSNVCVVGLWHLGLVTSAALADAGLRVCALDIDVERVEEINRGILPVDEPGLASLIDSSRAAGFLRFSDDPVDACSDSDVIWIAIDTPVDENDHADSDAVFQQVNRVLRTARRGALVIVSAQLPIGSTRLLRELYRAETNDEDADFVCIPENLRLGMAIKRFVSPDRVVVGADTARALERARIFLECIDAPIVEMSTAGAEATKHAINAFLATSIAFANEIGLVCRLNAIDPREVEAGLKSDERIGSRAYVRAGEGFAGGTLGRDLRYLELYEAHLAGGLPLLSSVEVSNTRYLHWPLRAIESLERGDYFPGDAPEIAILGLTYKSTTNTLRRSTAVAIGQTLVSNGRVTRGYSHVDLAENHELGFPVVVGDVSAVLRGADVAVVMSDAPQIANLTADDFIGLMRTPIVIDFGGFVPDAVVEDRRVQVIQSEVLSAIRE
jgi:UDPglucose 6-dehydrogenase